MSCDCLFSTYRIANPKTNLGGNTKRALAERNLGLRA